MDADPSDAGPRLQDAGSRGRLARRAEPERHAAADGPTPTDPARLLRRSARRKERIPTAGGSTLHLLVLSSTLEDTTVVDLATAHRHARAGALARGPRTGHQHLRRGRGDPGRRSRTRRPGPARGHHRGRPAPPRRHAAGPAAAQAPAAAGGQPRTARCSASRVRRPPTGSSGASGPRWPSSSPPGARS